jgi:hypothetical protein
MSNKPHNLPPRRRPACFFFLFTRKVFEQVRQKLNGKKITVIKVYRFVPPIVPFFSLQNPHQLFPNLPPIVR